MFTNVLYNILGYKDIFNHFLKFITNDASKKFNNIHFNISKEVVVNKGRIDLYAESDLYSIIIENKIHSGLNGVKLDDSCTQLKTYYDFIYNKTKKKPLCFITAPNYKINDLKNEIKKYDINMLDIFKIISYGQIAEFIRFVIDNKIFDNDFIYINYLEDVYISFKNHSLTLQEKYATKFLNAINKK